jgi:hypothetical protein
MSNYSFIDYIHSWWTQQENIKENSNTPTAPPLCTNVNPNANQNSSVGNLISVKDLQRMKLKHIENNIPGPARNMPSISKFKLHMLSKGHLEEILNVRLNPTSFPPRPTSFPPRHPVLCELIKKINIVKPV